MWTRFGGGVASLMSLGAVTSWAVPAAAEEARDFEGLPVAVPERRSGFSFGLAGGLALLQVQGYPNDVAQIGVPEFHAETDVSVTSGGALWIGGVLTDWLSLGVGLFGAGSSSDGLEAAGGAFQVRVETFPLFYYGEHLRDLGLVLSAGTGGYTIERNGEKLAEGAGTSVVGIGVFYEPWTWWRFSSGPQLEYGHHFSESLSAHTVVLGFRSAFYGGP